MNRFYKRLLWANTGLIFFGIVVALWAVVVLRPCISPTVASYIKKEIQNSAFAAFLNQQARGYSSEQASILSFMIKIKDQHMHTLAALNEKLVRQGALLEKDKIWFPAGFFHENETYKVKIRLRGDQENHWRGPKKSWRVKFDKENMFRGYRQINLVIPSDRQYEAEILAHSLSRKAGLLAPDSGFASVSLNGIDMGLYVWWEHFTKEMLERQNRPDAEMFTRKASSDMPYTKPSVQQGVALRRWDAFLRLLTSDDDEEILKKLRFYLDIEKFVRWNSISWLFGSSHPLSPFNSKWLYDPATGLFEPIFYDVGYIRSFQSKQPGADLSLDMRTPLTRRLLRIPEIQERRNKVLWEFVQNPDFDLAKQGSEMLAAILPYLTRGVSSLGLAEAEAIYDEHSRTYRENMAFFRKLLSEASVQGSALVRPADKGEGVILEVKLFTRSMSALQLDSVSMASTDASTIREARATLRREHDGKSETRISQVSSIFSAARRRFCYKNQEVVAYMERRIWHTRWVNRNRGAFGSFLTVD